MSRIRENYIKVVAPDLKSRFGYSARELIPSLTKIVLNAGSAEIQSNKAFLDTLVTDMTKISGQKSVVTKAKKAISSFKIRDGSPVGVMVTLRGMRMYDFLDKLISITIPRIRDFRGFSPKSFDGQGNYSLGLKEHTVFTEIPYESIEKVHGLQVTIHTTARTDDEGYALLQALGFPFSKSEKAKND